MSDPLFDSDNSDSDPQKDFEDLRRKMLTVHEKLTGKNSAKISLEDIAQYVRVVNYNFAALTNVMNKLLTGYTEVIMNQGIILEKLRMLDSQLKEFFEANSFINDTLKENTSDDDNSSQG